MKLNWNRSPIRERKVIDMKINKDLEDTIRYFLGMGEKEEAINILLANGLSKQEAREIVDEVEPMTIEEAFDYMNSA